MALKICALASGSKGNCIYISSGKTNLLVDAGIPFSAIRNGLKSIGADINEIDAVLVSHEHTDHIRALAQVSEVAAVYAHEQVWRALDGRAVVCREEKPFCDDVFSIGDIDVTPFRVPHDAAYTVGFSFDADGGKISVATDLGYMTRGVLSHLKGSDVVLLESNHDERLLRNGRYPEALKQRILSKNGHLSNETCALTVRELLSAGGTHTVILGHLSEENNRPDLAYKTSAAYAERLGARAGEDFTLAVAVQHEISGLFECKPFSPHLKRV
ncbi:MAG: MBL fold metallo-hydrolase [Clostridiales bacterium]|nr:MBL fold metallo-hydrolase [Clostridiales bacterium]